MTKPFTPLARLPWGTLRSWAAYALLPAVGLITAPILARVLGAEGRGQLAAILQPLTVADAFAAVGVPAAVTFYIAQGHSVKTVSRQAVWMLTASSALVYLALIFYAPTVARVAGVSPQLLIVVWSSVVIGAFISCRRSIWQGARAYKALDIERALSAIIRVALIVVLAVSLVTAPIINAVAFVGAGILASSFVLWRRLPPSLYDSDGRNDFKPSSMRLFALLASVSTISVALNNRLDQAVLPAAMSARELGVYSAGVTVAEVPLIIAIVTVRNLLAERSAGAESRTVWKTFTIGLLGVGGLGAALALLTPSLLPALFGAEFVEAIPVVQVLLLASIVGAGAGFLSTLTVASGRVGMAAVGPSVGVLVTVVGLTLFWSTVDPVIAAWIAVASQVAALVSSLFIWALLRKSTRVELEK